MSSEQHTDYSCLSRALWWAKKNGYKVPPLEQAVFDTNGAEPLRQSLRRWAQGMLFDHDFARAVFGEDEVDEWGHDFYAIRMQAIQVAVDHEGELFKVQPDRPNIVMIKAPVLDHLYKISDDDYFANTTVEYPEKVVYDIKKMVGQIPFRTHRLTEVDVVGGQPAWKHHIKQMAISANPFVYINDFIDEAIAKEKLPKNP